MNWKKKFVRNWGRLGMKCKLSDICVFRKGKVDVSKLTLKTYISTENMLPNKGGVTEASSLPTVQLTQEYKKGDILVSNIRPYFKKIWQAKCDGGCSNDVLVFQGNSNIDGDFLYYILANDDFYAYSMATSKGTKMPRGDKTSIMQYEVPIFDIDTQRKIASVLRSLDEKIELNSTINNNLEQQAQAIFKSWFIDLEPFSNRKPSDWSVSTLGNVSIMGAGGDKPQNVSPIKTDLYKYPIYSNGLSNEGLYGFTDKPKISEESVTVSARGTIGFVCLRHIPYVPIVRLVTLTPKTEIISAKYLYLWLKQLHITGTGTTQQQLTVPYFQKTEILVPSQEIVTLFTATVDPIFEKIWANQNENEKLSSLRDTLLPKLMSGELDVSGIDL